MHSALVIVEKPKLSNSGSPEERQLTEAWSQFLSSQHIEVLKHKCIEALGEGCLLITLNEGADALADVLHAASQSALPYRVLFFDKPPPWIIGSGR